MWAIVFLEQFILIRLYDYTCGCAACDWKNAWTTCPFLPSPPPSSSCFEHLLGYHGFHRLNWLHRFIRNRFIYPSCPNQTNGRLTFFLVWLVPLFPDIHTIRGSTLSQKKTKRTGAMIGWASATSFARYLCYIGHIRILPSNPVPYAFQKSIWKRQRPLSTSSISATTISPRIRLRLVVYSRRIHRHFPSSKGNNWKKKMSSFFVTPEFRFFCYLSNGIPTKFLIPIPTPADNGDILLGTPFLKQKEILFYCQSSTD